MLNPSHASHTNGKHRFGQFQPIHHGNQPAQLYVLASSPQPGSLVKGSFVFDALPTRAEHGNRINRKYLHFTFHTPTLSHCHVTCNTKLFTPQNTAGIEQNITSSACVNNFSNALFYHYKQTQIKSLTLLRIPLLNNPPLTLTAIAKYLSLQPSNMNKRSRGQKRRQKRINAERCTQLAASVRSLFMLTGARGSTVATPPLTREGLAGMALVALSRVKRALAATNQEMSAIYLIPERTMEDWLALGRLSLPASLYVLLVSGIILPTPGTPQDGEEPSPTPQQVVGGENVVADNSSPKSQAGSSSTT